MIVSLIVAMSENRVIGRNGGLPWHLPKDTQYFKRVTLDHTVVMGRKTYDEMKRPLANRRNVVITRNREFHPSGVTVVPNLAEGLALGATEREVFVIGGGEIFRQAMPRADRLYITVVHAQVEGDTFFPEFEHDGWVLESEERHEADLKHAYPFTFRVYSKVR